jgi:RNA polymerase sigma-70 factor (sigma-E family)
MDPAAMSFEEFVDAHVDDLLRTACLITWDDAEAEDLVQECLLKVAKRWPQVSSMEMPRAYARRILINLALDGRDRRSRRRVELGSLDAESGFPDHGPLEQSDPDAETAIDLLGQRSELLDALAHLSPQQRTVLVLRYFEDLSEAQVAEVLGCSAGTVKSSGSRGLARLRGLISPPPFPTEVCEP